MLALGWGLSWSCLLNSGLSMWLLVCPHSMVAGFQEQSLLREAGCDLSSEATCYHFHCGHILCGFKGREQRTPSLVGGVSKSQRKKSMWVILLLSSWENPSQGLAWCGSSFEICPSLPLFFFFFFNWSIVDFHIVQVQVYNKVFQLFIQIIFHCSLLQHIEYNSLCYTVNPCSLSMLYIVASLPFK